MEGNMNTSFSGDENSWVLGLPAQPRDGTSRSRQPRIIQPRGRAPAVGPRFGANYFVDVIVINAGEGIGEKIQSYFQGRERCPSQFKDRSCLGVILSAEGAISSPRLNIQGSALVYEGLYEIIRLSGFYFMPWNGQVQLSGSLKLTFCDPDGGVFGGTVVGSLIAATPLQVAVLTFIQDA